MALLRQIGVFHGQAEEEGRRCQTCTQAALVALREDKTMAQLCQEFDLHANDGQLTLENNFLERAHRGGIADCKMMKADLALMRQIDQLHLEHTFMGQRMLVRQLKRQGVQVGPTARAHALATHGHLRPGPAAWHQ